MHPKYPLLGNETILTETCVINVFQHYWYQNTKLRESLSISKNITTLPKTCIMSVFAMLRTKTSNADKHPIWQKKKKKITKMVYYECY